MTDESPILLLTRPAPQSERFAEELRDLLGRQVTVVISPVLRISQLGLEPVRGPYAFVVLTSANAVPALDQASQLRGLQVFCVGDRTADAVRRAGWPAVSAGGSAEDLVSLIAEKRPRGRGLHIRGRHVAVDIEKSLNSLGIETESVVGYSQDPVSITDEARRVLAGNRQVIVPIFSPRSARILSEAVKDLVAPMHVIAISDAVAAAWTAPANSMTVAHNPDAPSMLRAIEDRFRG